jgi:hypothetical protein
MATGHGRLASAFACVVFSGLLSAALPSDVNSYTLLPCPVPTTGPVGRLALHKTGVLLLRPLTWQGCTSTRYDRGRRGQPHSITTSHTLRASCSPLLVIVIDTALPPVSAEPVSSKTLRYQTPSSLLVPIQVCQSHFHSHLHSISTQSPMLPLCILHHQRRRHRSNKPKVRGTRLHHRRRQRLGHATALAVIRHVVGLRRHLKHGPIRRALVVEVDKKEVGRSVPRR